MRIASQTLLSMLVVGLLPGGSALAQTNDRFYRSWGWRSEEPTARAAGLGGATVALADDPSAALLNPAGILTMTKSGVQVSLWHAGPASAARDPVAGGSSLGFLGGAGSLGAKWGIGGYLVRPRVLDLALSESPLPDGSLDAGYLRGEVTDAAGATAWNPRGRLFLGLRVTATHLRLEGSHAQTDADGAPSLRVGTSAGSTRVTASLGVLHETDRVRLGLVITPGASWKAERTAESPALGAILDPGSQYEVRAPGVVAAGASASLGDRVLVSAQLDYVRYSEIRETLVIRRGVFQREDYELGDALEPRLGVEASLPLGRVSLQARAGVHGQASGALAYRRADAVEAAAFAGGERTWSVAAGGSLVTRSLALDAAVTSGGGTTRILVAAAVRF